MNKYKETFGVDISKPAYRQAGVPEIHSKTRKKWSRNGVFIHSSKKDLICSKKLMFKHLKNNQLLN
ncbi:hypothetical protein [Cellulophaga sp. HaHa_2_1]|uniref:hypothetical protein n=1 Tax=Cellulophaga sp. HaHa_2_1 TaxID=2749994 RepID=UPI001C4EF23E|nr:hypothetical protein [Cellulophaga sp. HaHa_2_1]QXP52505.1 hypothetical protein H0I24_00850 [Cellulophaga sp. HaHa_2_1]